MYFSCKESEENKSKVVLFVYFRGIEELYYTFIEMQISQSSKALQYKTCYFLSQKTYYIKMNFFFISKFFQK